MGFFFFYPAITSWWENVEYKSKDLDYNVRCNQEVQADIFEVCPARLLAVGHDAILIGIVVSDLDSSPSSCSSSLSLPLSSTITIPRAILLCYLSRNRKRIDFHLRRLPWDGRQWPVAHSIKLIDSSNTSFAASSFDCYGVSLFLSISFSHIQKISDTWIVYLLHYNDWER